MNMIFNSTTKNIVVAVFSSRIRIMVARYQYRYYDRQCRGLSVPNADFVQYRPSITSDDFFEPYTWYWKYNP